MKRAWLLVGTILACGCDKEAGSSPSTSASTTATEPTTPSASATPPSAPTAAASISSPAPAPDTIIAQHILCAYKGAKRAPKGVTRSKAEARARAQEALGKVRAGTPFEDVVKQYSDDTGSVDRMGSLGKFHREDMDPAFGKAAFALKPGEISDVVETPFGFHVIKRTQ